LVETYKQLQDVAEAVTLAEASPERELTSKRRCVKGSPVKKGLISNELMDLKADLEDKAAILHSQSSGRVPYPAVPEQAVMPYMLAVPNGFSTGI